MTDTNTARRLAELRATGDAVRSGGWVSPGLGTPAAPLHLLGSTHNPLSGLDAAGLGWLTPLVSFLGDPLTRLQGGDGASVTSGSQDFTDAGTDIAGVADTYRASTSAQTSEWSGPAASGYRAAGARHADGVAGLGQASSTVGGAIIGAGQVVAQAIAEVTELISEAVAQIVPIMTQAMARAAETFGQSVVEAIPPCVGIAVEHATKIAAKLAALLASGDNLLKLVRGGMAAVDVIQQALSGIGQRSVGAVDSASATAAGDPGAGGSPPPVSSAGGYGTGPSTPGGSVAPQGTRSWTPPASPVGGAVEPAHSTPLDAARTPGHVSGSGVSTTASPGGGGRAGGGSGAGSAADAARQDTEGPIA